MVTITITAAVNEEQAEVHDIAVPDAIVGDLQGVHPAEWARDLVQSVVEQRTEVLRQRVRDLDETRAVLEKLVAGTPEDRARILSAAGVDVKEEAGDAQSDATRVGQPD